MKSDTFVIIMAGGVGSRFWPVSTERKPKQFLDMLGTGKTLFQHTVERFDEICPRRNIYVVTSDQYIDIVKSQCPEIPDSNILAEPVMRNTAPCIAYASYKINKLNSNANIIVTPSDHLIEQKQLFQEALEKGLSFVRDKDAILTIGIQPHRPETGFGYIQMEKSDDEVGKVKAFKEKPNIETAKEYLQRGDFLWNAGIFLWSVKTITKAFETYMPAMARVFQNGEELYFTDKEQSFIDLVYPTFQSISIDYSLLEKANNLYVQKANFDWSDLGTWSALWEKSARNYSGDTVSSENAYLYETSNNIIHVPEDKVVVVQGLSEYIVVESNNVLLICSKGEEQRIKAFSHKASGRK
ncbi:mannose-1-phosphate guanylyltransferase [uncultured Sunxiuqinia sp.]|uniref:mannose-1-phosphate guanylyltransferase n=1 Tax=uncultured Sunxiuqinia sp. TaxID=1573825 RepID=UPI002AA5E8E9|nr:mannose-1-phosphate guanylyltransferase [uncultured Sunxiuqinia sp.]